MPSGERYDAYICRICFLSASPSSFTAKYGSRVLAKSAFVHNAEWDPILSTSSTLDNLIDQLKKGNYSFSQLVIFIDNSSFLAAIRNICPGRKCIETCQNSLNSLGNGPGRTITLRFCPAKLHKTEPWKAIFNFKDSDPLICVQPTITLVRPISIKETLTEWMIGKWNGEWSQGGNANPTCRQSRRFWPSINLETSKELIKLDRENLSRVIQIISGHGFNKHHQAVTGRTVDEECRFCLEEDEETWHVVMECPALASVRNSVFESNAEEVFNIKLPEDIPRLSCFLSKASIDSLFCPLTGED